MPNSVNASAGNLVYELPSILRPLALAELFPRCQPLEVELGCGDASFLVSCARQNPERNYMGIERLLGRIRKLDRKGRRAGLSNLRGLRIESTYFLRYLLPPHAADALHVYFPDPWPKRKHAKHRMISEGFPALSAQALAPGGVLYLRTDDDSYFQQMLDVFKNAPAWRAVPTPAALKALLTDFEQDFQKHGIRTRHAAFQNQSLSQ
jgi:tRNA (guanine-N7-)-methyltransferase